MPDYPRPALRQPLLSAQEQTSSWSLLAAAQNVGEGGASESAAVVQFSSPQLIVSEGDAKAVLSLMRLGPLDSTASVDFSCTEGSGKVGEAYVDKSARVTFGPQEWHKEVEVELIDNDHWTSTVEFKAELSNPSGCELGTYLGKCRVKIIDNEPFPTSKYEKELLCQEVEEEVEKLGVGLFVEFLRCIWAYKNSAFKTMLILTFDQMGNVYFAFTLYMNIYLVDVIFSTKEEAKEELWFSTPIKTAQFAGMMYILPMFLLHFWDYKKAKLDLSGQIVDFLRTNLFRRYLSYTERSRAHINQVMMHEAVMTDCMELAEGYMGILELVTIVGRLAILAFFILKENTAAIVPVGIMPLLFVAWVWLRSSILNEANEKVAKVKGDLEDVVHQVISRFRLIADFAQRFVFSEHFHEYNETMLERLLDKEIIELNNNYFPKWLGPLFIGVYIICFSSSVDVLGGSIKVGVFLATIRVFNELSEQFSEGYEVLMKVTVVIGPLRKLAVYLNAQIELDGQMHVDKWRRETTVKKRQAVVSDHKTSNTTCQGADPVDAIKIAIHELQYGYRDKQGDPRVLFRNVNLELEQGTKVAVVGPQGCGKSTLLRLMGHSMYASTRDGEKNKIFIPTHLRILNVEHEPHLLLGDHFGVLANIALGGQSKDENNQRICTILELLGCPEVLRMAKEEIADMKETQKFNRGRGGSYLDVPDRQRSYRRTTARISMEDEEGEHDDDDFNDGNKHWQTALSYSDRAKISLARALFMNPNVMVLHKPTMHFPSLSGHIMQVLDLHVKCRGIGYSKNSVFHRRPRTLFYTVMLRKELEFADHIWCISGSVKLGLSHSRLRELTDDDLSNKLGLNISPETQSVNELGKHRLLEMQDDELGLNIRERTG